MAQKMTDNNKPYVMALFSGAAYKNPEDAKKTFDDYQFVNQKFIDMGGAQCYVVWNDHQLPIQKGQSLSFVHQVAQFRPYTFYICTVAFMILYG